MTLLRRNAIANVLGRAATAVLWIAVTPFVLSRLGPERFGIWSLFFAFNTYLLSLDLGIGGALLRFIAVQRPSGDRRSLARTLRWGLWGAIALGLIWSALIVLTRGWIATSFHVPDNLRPEALDSLVIFAAGTLLIFPVQVLVASLQGFERLDLSNLCMFLGVLAQSLVLVAGISAGGGIKAAALAGVVGQVVSGLLAGLLLRKQLRAVREDGQGTAPSLRDVIRLGGALQLLGVLNIFQFQAGRIVLGLVGNLTMVAQYELAFRVALAVYSIPILIQGAVIPTVSRTEQSEEPAAVRSLFTRATQWIYTQSVIALGLLWLLAPDLVRFWLGSGHEPIAHLIRWWAIAFVASVAYAPGVAIARGLGKPWFEVWSYCAALLTHVGLAILFVPRFGTAGAVAAAAVSFVVGFLVFVPVFHRRCAIPFLPWFQGELVPRVVAGSLAVALGAWLLGMGPVASHLPPPGLAHGVVATLVFMALFGVFFIPLGDTQRLSQTIWQITSAMLVRRRA